MYAARGFLRKGAFSPSSVHNTKRLELCKCTLEQRTGESIEEAISEIKPLFSEKSAENSEKN